MHYRGIHRRRDPMFLRRPVRRSGSGLILPFSAGVFANASGDRTLLAKNSSGLYEMTGPFAANVLATRVKNGVKYGSFFQQYETINAYSDALRDVLTSYWTNTGIGVTDNAINSPIGTLTADLLTEDTSTGNHRVSKSSLLVDGISRYFVTLLVKTNGRTRGRLLVNGGFSAQISIRFNFSTITTYDEANTDIYGILHLIDDYFLIYASAVSDVATGCGIFWMFTNDSNLESYTGDGASGQYVWRVNFIKANHLPPSIYVGSSPAVQAPDVFYFPAASIPSWMKKKFKVKLIPNYDIPSQVTHDKPIWSFQKTAQTLATGTDNYGMTGNSTTLYWANYSGSKIQSISIGGGTPTDLATGINTPRDVAINATTIFWISRYGYKIQSMPIGGGSVTDLVTGLTNPFCLDVDSTNIYWTDKSDNKIYKAPIGGGSPTEVVTGLNNPTGIKLVGDDIYFLDIGTQLKTVPKTGGTPTILLSGFTTAKSLDIDDNFIYVSDDGTAHVSIINRSSYTIVTLLTETGVFGVSVLNGALFYNGSSASGTTKRLDIVTAWLTTTGTIKVVDGLDTKVETSAATASMHDELEIEFDRENGKITLAGFTTGDGEYTDEVWAEPTSDFDYGGGYKGAAQTNGLVSEPTG